MKAILKSIKPKWVAKILNGEKTIEIRKRFPKDYRGWVYIYCTKDKKNNLYWTNKWITIPQIKEIPSIRNGKVVARFWCDKVKSIWKTTTNIWTYGSDLEPNFYKESCLNDIELDRYFKPTKVGFGKVYGYAIHISDLEIFDKPKELSEFKVKRKINECNGCKYLDTNTYEHCIKCEETRPLTKAPQNFCYIEV